MGPPSPVYILKEVTRAESTSAIFPGTGMSFGFVFETDSKRWVWQSDCVIAQPAALWDDFQQLFMAANHPRFTELLEFSIVQKSRVELSRKADPACTGQTEPGRVRCCWYAAVPSFRTTKRTPLSRTPARHNVGRNPSPTITRRRIATTTSRDDGPPCSLTATRRAVRCFVNLTAIAISATRLCCTECVKWCARRQRDRYDAAGRLERLRARELLERQITVPVGGTPERVLQLTLASRRDRDPREDMDEFLATGHLLPTRDGF